MDKETKPAAKPKPATKAAKAAIKQADQFIVANIEKVHVSQYGERMSKAYDCTYLPTDWSHFQAHGPRAGMFVHEVKESPKGVDLGYKNPDGSGIGSDGTPFAPPSKKGK